VIYPHVLSESDTLDRVLVGQSLARYGDGEFHLCHGRSAKAQIANPVLRGRLCDILQDPGGCLVGIPNLHSDTPKAAFWAPFAQHHSLLAQRSYGSSFVTRPDSAPWIDIPDYWARLSSLWEGQDVTLVRGESAKALQASDLTGARTVTVVNCPKRNAFGQYAQILARVGTPARALLCLGPTATVLAVDLSHLGVHAIDLGHVALFLRKHRKGEPMVLTPAEKVAA